MNGPKAGAAVFIALLGWPILAASHAPAEAPAAAPAAQSRRWLRSLSLRDRVAQLVMVPISGTFPNVRSREYRKLVRLIREVRVGGLVLVNVAEGKLVRRAEPYELAAFLNRAQRMARIPLIVGGDFERGASMRVEDTTVFPHAMAFGAAGDPEATRYEGAVTAREARAMGVHWIFYPVADVNNNPENPIINIRSFGEDPRRVSGHVAAFIEGARSDPRYRVLVAVKHFPGHGDTAIDTHLNLATITGGRARLDQVELPPFRAAIAAGADSVMTAHIAVPSLDPSGAPATLSRPILSGLLRRDLGFRGLVITDALDMGGIVKGFGAGEAAVRALEAGVDVLLMPPDPDAAIRAVMAAVQSGRLTRKRIDESVLRLLAAKERIGLSRTRLIDIDAIADSIDSPEANERAQEVADRAITLVTDSGRNLPLTAPAETCFVILVESRRSTQGQAFAEEIRQRSPQAKVIALDAVMPKPDLEAALETAAGSKSVVVAAFSAVAAYRGDTALAGEFPWLVNALIESGKPVVFVALGNPYLLRSFPKVSAYIAAFSTVPPSELAAVKALFGEIPFRGRLPVTIPGVAPSGTGIQAESTQVPTR